jgi:DNA (cytosine-5)-methyltransferase 1
MNANFPLRVASLFSGCGGLDHGFHENSSFDIVFVNDIDKDSCATYEKNFGVKPTCKDVKTLESIPTCDVLIGGFPCQGFSVANTNRCEQDERNGLYKELVRHLVQSKPSYFVFENVKGILSLGGYDNVQDKKNKMGKVFKLILQEFGDCGYHVYHKLVKMMDYGIPQKRERVIFFGIRNDVWQNHPSFDWPTISVNFSHLTLQKTIGDLSIDEDVSLQHIGTKHKVKITGYIGNRKLDWDDVAPTIIGRGGGTGGPVINVHPSGKRRMTVREYARIQTFEDTFMFSGSVSSMFRQIGNAVPPKFSVIIAEMIEKYHLEMVQSRTVDSHE